MTHKEKYSIYNEMVKRATVLENLTRKHFEKTNRTIYNISFFVADEETRKYFVDIEIGNSYKRIYGNYTEEQLSSILK